MPTTTFPAVVDALKALLVARAGIIGPPKVEVYTAGMGDDTAPESITFYSADGEESWAVMPYSSSRGKRDNYTILGEVLIYKEGAGDATAKAARDRTLAIFNELETAVRADPRLGNAVAGVFNVAIESKRWRQGIVPNARLCSVIFEVACKYRI